MSHLQAEFEAFDVGEMPKLGTKSDEARRLRLTAEASSEEEIESAIASLPLLIGADGVMVPLRPNGGHPRSERERLALSPGFDFTSWTYRLA